MKQEDIVADIIKYVNENHSDIHGLDKVAILKTVASYYEFITAAEATKESFLRMFKNIAG